MWCYIAKYIVSPVPLLSKNWYGVDFISLANVQNTLTQATYFIEYFTSFSETNRQTPSI
jgi:hypothetical protein